MRELPDDNLPDARIDRSPEINQDILGAAMYHIRENISAIEGLIQSKGSDPERKGALEVERARMTLLERGGGDLRQDKIEAWASLGRIAMAQTKTAPKG